MAIKPKSEYTIVPVGDFSYNLFEHGKNARRYDTVKVNHSQLKSTLSETDRKDVIGIQL